MRGFARYAALRYYRPPVIPTIAAYRGNLLKTSTASSVLLSRNYSSENEKSFFITTPIFYVNAAPHLGHMYTAVLADAIARWQRLCGRDVVYSTGTDEHGLKIQQAAESQGLPPREFCDSVSSKFKGLFDNVDISYSHYVRTTQPSHQEATLALWNRLIERDFIYKGTYEGWYSTSDEAFLTEDQVKEVTDKNGQTTMMSIDSGRPVEWMKESNYMFRLSHFAPQLSDWLDTKVITPDVHAHGLRSRLKFGLDDLSVSRERSRLQWGIPVPGDDSQTIYVWLDALTNYLTVSGFPDRHDACWPADVHVVGKDILTFHALYWPAFLMAADLPLPRKILCHSHWLSDGIKMSKSLGNVVNPLDSVQRYGVDGLRYYLLRDGVPHMDGNYRDDRAKTCLNAEVCNTMGNLLSRSTGKAINPSQQFPSFNQDVFQALAREDDVLMWKRLHSLPAATKKEYEDLHVYRAIDCIMAHLRDVNGFMQHHQPWQMAKDPKCAAELAVVLHVAMESLRVAGILLQPVIPNLASELLNRLSVPANQRTFSNAERSFPGDSPLGMDTGPLYRRLKS
ncbi:hypothetical protein CAPTEDRAFT_177027 [Capitella teleta]|uniref:Methionine--tRNA ligase, mitochondrial n=1 Tax=Capitella teleta TaxID=283909 RepID=R7TWB2_CAPTE|nr:hypothetical protein CAPTEDRAFT_177027 [Capitella teleta]|eukprot:ELT98029.1 hypothetical protein CAPTEDRAFT_177027 [Capitella teleta]